MKHIQPNRTAAKHAAILYNLHIGQTPKTFVRITQTGIPGPKAKAFEVALIAAARAKYPNLTNDDSRAGAGVDETRDNIAYEWFFLTGEVFYVGVTTNFTARTAQHINAALDGIECRLVKPTAKAMLIDTAESMGPLLFCLVSENRLPKRLRGWFSLSPDGLSPTARKRGTCIKKLPCGVWMWYDCSAASVVSLTRDIWAALDSFWPGWNDWSEWWHIRANGPPADSLELRDACFSAAARARARKTGKAASATAGLIKRSLPS